MVVGHRGRNRHLGGLRVAECVDGITLEVESCMGVDGGVDVGWINSLITTSSTPCSRTGVAVE